MDKDSLQPGQQYAYRANVRAWEKGEDVPVRVTLVESLPHGKHRIRLPDGDEIEVRSAQLVIRWDPEEIDELLRREERSRAFSAETIRDRHLAEAINLVLNTVSADAYASHDRASIPAHDAEEVQKAAEIRDALMDLSPVAYRDEYEDNVYLPLPVAGELARRIAERNPDAVVTAAEANLNDFRSRGYLAIVPEHYKPGWDVAVEWAGRTPVPLPEPETSPADAYKQLWKKLRGRGVRKTGDEEHVWCVPDEMLMELSHLLAGAARYSGRLTLRPLRDGQIRLSLDSGHRWPAGTPDEIRNLALSLSREQEVALGELQRGPSGGATFAELAAHPRTVESLISRGLVEEVDSDALAERTDLRVRLTDAAWRVLQHLGPRSL